MNASRRAILAGVPGVAVARLTGEGRAATAPAGRGLVVEGRRPIDRDTVIAGPVTIRPGAAFIVAPGATLTLLGDLDAPADRIFEGEGTADLSGSRVVAARPEWWGARADDPAVDCGPALTACLRAHPAMQLGLGDYHLAATLTIDQPNRRVWGIGRTNGARGTRLVLTADAGPVVLVGHERRPAEINDYLRGIDMRWIELGRARAAPAPANDDVSAAVGLAIRHVLDCTFEGLRANEHAVGYSVRGAVRTFLRDCAAFRSLFTDQKRDVFVGFEMDGRVPPIATGANASVYVIDCVARTGNRPRLRRSIGCWLRGALSDTFLVRFETTEVGTGIEVDGDTAALTAQGRQFGHVDLHIETPVLDQCLDAGIRLSDLSEHALVDVSAPYVGLAAGAKAAAEVVRSGGQVGITGGQFIGALAPGATGLSLRDCEGVSVAGLKLAGFGRPAEAIGSRGLDLVLGVNTAGAASAGAPALRVERGEDIYCRPRITGPAAIHAVGVAIDDATTATVEIAAISRRTVASAVSVAGRTAMPATGTSAIVVANSSRS